jgi:hypothetical protein
MASVTAPAAIIVPAWCRSRVAGARGRGGQDAWVFGDDGHRTLLSNLSREENIHLNPVYEPCGGKAASLASGNLSLA